MKGGGKKKFIDKEKATHYYLKEAVVTESFKALQQQIREGKDYEAGQAVLYGIDYDDTDYDYTQHLRALGMGPGAVLLEAPSKNRTEKKPGVVFKENEKVEPPPPPPPASVSVQISTVDEEDPETAELLSALDRDDCNSDSADDFFDELLADDVIHNQVEPSSFTDQEDEDEEKSGLREYTFEQKSPPKRSERLELLDRQFEQMLKNEYNSDYENEDEEDDEYEDDSNEEEEEEVVAHKEREDFDDIMNQFLDNAQEIHDFTSLEPGKSDQIDEEAESRELTLRYLESIANKSEKEEMVYVEVSSSENDEQEKWDCQTILTTYTNTENIPAMIREPTTGKSTGRTSKLEVINSEEEEEEESEEEEAKPKTNKGAARPKNETAEERRLRKQAIKSERKNKLMEKKKRADCLTAKKQQQVNQREGGKARGVHTIL